ncbi:MAG: hypothetical protein NC548_41465 [Lachnospiraceae bacterium]|nr:hypothetical protein [Lachnospiraceae bacterium]
MREVEATVETTPFKSDEEYGYKISLDEDRSYARGYRFGFNESDTDVSALRKIINGWFDVSDIEHIKAFADHKLDFSITVLDTLVLAFTEKVDKVRAEFAELEDESNDIAHRITKAVLTGKSVTPKEKIQIYDEHEKVLVQRRKVKDTLSVLEAVLDNMVKSRNFILSMNQRQYRAKSTKYKGDPNFDMRSKADIYGENNERPECRATHVTTVRS